MKPAYISYLNSNDGTALLAYGCIKEWIIESRESLKEFSEYLSHGNKDYVFGYLSYELRILLMDLGGTENTSLQLPKAHFWIPTFVAKISGKDFSLVQGETSSVDYPAFLGIYEALKTPKPLDLPLFTARTSKLSYLEKVALLKEKIQRGDIYETNYCQEYFLKEAEPTDPIALYHYVNQKTTAPFSAMVVTENLWLACGSPERFMKKSGSKLISQPIKGTAPRFINEAEDLSSIERLKSSKKEHAENVMIVDLVRNDLSKIATRGSVRLEEMCEIYSFKTVHQMISTVACDLPDGIRFEDVIAAMFPMGSMTGAPKLNAVKFSDEAEEFSREIYSGSVGYITPELDFDFNVVIRSLAYYPATKYLSCAVGSAITMASDPLEEYEECVAKIGKIIQFNHD